MDTPTGEARRFHWADYVVFFLSIIFSTAIGFVIVYRVQFKKKSKPQESERREASVDYGSDRINEYLIGNRQMHLLPVSLSLVGSYVSGVTILGTVSNVYSFGTQYSLIFFAILLMALPVAFIFTPVFVNLGIHSSYEYLEMRFGRGVRTFSALLFLYDEIIYLPMILHIPSLAFNQVTGINAFIVSGVLCIICMLYTVFGGIKAVVQTDAYQVAIMYFSVIIAVIVGTCYLGGPSPAFHSAYENGRLIFFNMSPSMYEHHSFWGVLIGGFCYWMSFNSVNQTMVQRYMALSSIRKAQFAIMIFSIGIALFIAILCFAGLLVYHYFKDCDPLVSKQINLYDQLFPLYVMSTLGHIPGLCGLFISGIFGAALSSLSVVLNATSLVILEDITKGLLGIQLSEKKSVYLLYISILVLGIIALAGSSVFSKLGGILGVMTSLTAVAESTNFGLFSLGMLVPWCNNIGAIAGGAAGFVVTAILSLGNQIVYMIGYNTAAQYALDISVKGCVNNVTLPKEDNSEYNVENLFPIFRLSFHWINPIGVLVTVITGTLVSICTGRSMDTDPNLLAPILQKYFLKKNNALVEDAVKNTNAKK